ncbi:MAG: ATP-binding protein, partial [Spirochaetales bacterium]|nr:ATP-binding protein [Spirochaetales bacterium]
GQGIDPNDLERIFDPFFTTKDVGQGTGLGLSIVYDIIRAHHGTITVDSTPGEGTVFTISLPSEAEPTDQLADAVM